MSKIDQERYNISKKFFGDSLEACKAIPASNSLGLLLDSVIVCNILKSLPATPFFYFESYQKNNLKSGWIFVNLDTTNFRKLREDSASPNILLCKTKQVYTALSSYFRGTEKSVIYTGFTSLDKYSPGITKDYRKFIHVPGKSSWKGTECLLSTWLKHPEWPLLSIVCRDTVVLTCKKLYSTAENIQLITGHVPDEKLNILSNSSGIHVCPSEHEDFGHYINEARGMASVVLYTNAPSMSEKFSDGVNGFAIDCYQADKMNNGICPIYKVTSETIEKTINKVLDTSIEKLKQIGNEARKSFLVDHTEFEAKLTSMVLGGNSIPHVVHSIWLSKNDPYKDVEMPEKYKKYMESWYKNNGKSFKYEFWSGRKILNLISEQLPEFLNFYQSLTNLISKCDFSRFAIVYIYGGVYTDLDFFCRKDISPLLVGDSYFILEPREHFIDDIPFLFNGIFAAAPRHRFVYGWLKAMSLKNPRGDIMETTGPKGFFKYFRLAETTVLIGNTCSLSSITQKGEISSQCSDTYNNYTCTVWKDGSDWGNSYGNVDKDAYSEGKFKYVTNPLDGSQMVWESGKNIPVIPNWQEYSGNSDITIQAKFSIPLACALRNMGKENIVYAESTSSELLEFTEKMALINTLGKLVVKKIS